MRKELIEFAKTVCDETLLEEIQKYVQDIDELRYVFKMAKQNSKK